MAGCECMMESGGVQVGGRGDREDTKLKKMTADPHYAYAYSVFIGSHWPLWNKIQIPNTPSLFCPFLSFLSPVPLSLGPT